jgi:CRP-like cAMP-binding protein
MNNAVMSTDTDAPCELNSAGTNHLLDLLAEDERARLLGRMERLSVRHKDMVFRRGERIAFVDFPLSAMISVVTTMHDGGVVEVGTVGSEGFAGLPLFFGVPHDANDAFYQAPGETLRMAAADFTAELALRGRFEQVVRRYAQAFYCQITQSVGCNRLHPVEQRLSRWLLMSQDRVQRPVIELTQEFLADMLGVRRASVSEVAGALQHAGLIRYSRGVIEIIDRAGLEKASCECYAVVRREFERLLC